MSSLKGDETMAKVTKLDNVASWTMVGKSTNAKKIADALKQVGLDFEVEKRPIFF